MSFFTFTCGANTRDSCILSTALSTAGAGVAEIDAWSSGWVGGASLSADEQLEASDAMLPLPETKGEEPVKKGDAL